MGASQTSTKMCNISQFLKYKQWELLQLKAKEKLLTSSTYFLWILGTKENLLNFAIRPHNSTVMINSRRSWSTESFGL